MNKYNTTIYLIIIYFHYIYEGMHDNFKIESDLLNDFKNNRVVS